MIKLNNFLRVNPKLLCYFSDVDNDKEKKRGITLSFMSESPSTIFYDSKEAKDKDIDLLLKAIK